MGSYGRAAAAVVLLIVITYAAIRFMLPLFTPFVIAVFMAALIDPGVTFLQRKLRLPRGVAAILVLAVMGISLGLLLWIGIVEIGAELEQLSQNDGALSAAFSKGIDQLMAAITRIFEQLPAPVADAIRANQGRVVALAESAVVWLTGVARGLPQFTIVLLISTISTFFIARDSAILSETVTNALPKPWRKQFRRIRSELVAGFTGYMRGRFVLIAITMILTLFGLSAMGVSYSWLLALTCGVLDIIPLIGPSVLFLPWAFYHAIIGNIGYAIGLVAVLFVTSAIRQVAEARVMGSSLDLHPLAALISVYVGVRLFGVTGLIAGPIAVVFVKAVYRFVIRPMLPAEEE
ncbi:MAG: sporulation integral membrane protein YtvI [Clostridia bacterium]|nr:sporulation integral membrane protein YtvI [Clostridia bacterium]